jgi:hypothetical protein
MAGPPDRQAARNSGATLGTAVAIEALLEDAQGLALAAFEARHGAGFLLVTSMGGMDPKATATTQLLLDVDVEPAARTANLATVVYPLRSKSSAGGELVTIGRETNHDVVIPDMSISRFHAFAKRAANGSFQLQDVGSTNGTAVNGASVPPRGAGPPTAVKPGDTVRLGQLECTFTDAAGLRSFVTKTAG